MSEELTHFPQELIRHLSETVGIKLEFLYYSLSTTEKCHVVYGMTLSFLDRPLRLNANRGLKR
jgi:hypothetical protein